MRSSFIVALVLVAAGCAAQSIVDNSAADPSGNARVQQLPSGLEEAVSITPVAPQHGENVSIRSVIRNPGREAVTLTSRICGLDLGGTVVLNWPSGFVVCAGFSVMGPLAPGDSVVGYSLMRVDSPAGEYSLRVRHALTPEAWYEMPVRVRE